MNDPFKTHGAFSWMELMTSSQAEAIKFYKAALGWDFNSMPMPGNEDRTYEIASAGGQQIGGVMAFPPGYEGPPCWGAYITVDDIDALAGQVPTLGGQVIHPPTNIPGIGRFAVFQDPQGAVFNAITYKMPEE